MAKKNSKVSQSFKDVIERQLIIHSMNEPSFEKRMELKDKNIDDCITYILNTVKKSKREGFTDDEIYCMAIHYYDEDNVDIGKGVPSGSYVINHQVPLSEEERSQAKKEAYNNVIKREEERLTKKKKNKSNKSENEEQNTLFKT